jgi:hypothetical protein
MGLDGILSHVKIPDEAEQDTRAHALTFLASLYSNQHQAVRVNIFWSTVTNNRTNQENYGAYTQFSYLKIPSFLLHERGIMQNMF